jgi:hypothetical protein
LQCLTKFFLISQGNKNVAFGACEQILKYQKSHLKKISGFQEMSKVSMLVFSHSVFTPLGLAGLLMFWKN